MRGKILPIIESCLALAPLIHSSESYEDKEWRYNCQSFLSFVRLSTMLLDLEQDNKTRSIIAAFLAANIAHFIYHKNELANEAEARKQQELVERQRRRELREQEEQQRRAREEAHLRNVRYEIGQIARNLDLLPSEATRDTAWNRLNEIINRENPEARQALRETIDWAQNTIDPDRFRTEQSLERLRTLVHNYRQNLINRIDNAADNQENLNINVFTQNELNHAQRLDQEFTRENEAAERRISATGRLNLLAHLQLNVGLIQQNGIRESQRLMTRYLPDRIREANQQRRIRALR